MDLDLINYNNSNNSNQVIDENVKILKFTNKFREYTVCLWKLTPTLRRFPPQIGK